MLDRAVRGPRATRTSSEEPRGTRRPPPRPPRRDDARLGEMARLRGEGLTLAEIAARFDITRERVRQLLRHAGGSTDGRDARRIRQLEAARAALEGLLAGFRAGRSTAETARELGVTPAAATRVLRESITASDRAERARNRSVNRLQASTYSREAILRALLDVARLTEGPPTSSEYGRHARRLRLPSLPTVTTRFGSWAEAVRAAGMTPHTSPRRAYDRHWTEERCWQALQRLVAELGEAPTAAQYEVLASADEDLPSLATVRNRLGRWSEIVARLVVDAHPHPTLRRLGISPRATDRERDDAIWLAHLEGEIEDEEMNELLAADLFRWDPSYGPPPGD